MNIFLLKLRTCLIYVISTTPMIQYPGSLSVYRKSLVQMHEEQR